MERSPTGVEQEHEISVSIASPDDAEGIQEVFYQTWLATYPNEELGITKDDIEERFKNRNTPEGIAKRRNEIEHPPQGATFLVAKEGDTVVGLCVAFEREMVNQLQAIYVLPGHQGKGIGNKLWTEAQKYFNAAKDTIVQVATYNNNAIAFYERLGFQDDGKRWANEKFTMKSGAIIPEMEMVLKAPPESDK